MAYKPYILSIERLEKQVDKYLRSGVEQWCIKRELSADPNNTEMVFTRQYKPLRVKNYQVFFSTTHLQQAARLIT